MAVSKSRKSTHSIMEHAGFGSVTLIQNGLQFVVPQTCINSAGGIKTHLFKLIKKCVTISDAEQLHKFGIEVTNR